LSDTPQVHILCLNSGSSSLKFAVYGDRESVCLEGQAEPVGRGDGRLTVRGPAGEMLAEEAADLPSHRDAVRKVLEFLSREGNPVPDAAGHRLVHGGPVHSAPERVTPDLLRDLERAVPFAPLHLPREIEAIRTIAEHFPGLPQVACFDTAFHQRMPELAKRFPLPRRFWDEGIRRYGFHGLSYDYILSALGAEARGRVILAHLGNGASLAAVRDGEPVETTMGFTPLAGLMMGTRCGDLDPGLVVYLIRERGYDGDRLDRLLDRESGLLGVSETSSDMRVLLAQRAEDPRAAQAVDLFCYRVRQHIGALSAVLGGLDTLVFSGGIGEFAAPVRGEICSGLDHLGIRLDPEKNQRNGPLISTDQASVTVRVIHTDEARVIARRTRACLGW
jgi:acetate kinase